MPAHSINFYRAKKKSNPQNQIKQLLDTGNLAWVVLFFMGAGILLAFTACMYPLLPILSAIILAGNTQNRWRNFSLSLAYTQGLAVCYAIMGIIAALTGTLLSNALQTPIAIGVTSVLFLVLALSMFGVFSLQVPPSWQSCLQENSTRLQGGRVVGVFFMGLLSALMVGACVGPVLFGALTWIAQTQQLWLGGIALYALGVGIGIPLLIVAVFGNALLPKAGAWMTLVKQILGLMLLLVAIWFARSLFSAIVYQSLLLAALIGTALYFAWAARHKTKGHALTRIILCIALLGAASVVAWRLANPPAHENFKSLSFTPIKSNADLQRQIQQAKQNRQEVLLDFYADWCVACIEMEHTTFKDPQVKARLQDTVRLKLDITHNTAEDAAMLKQFGLFGPPALIHFDEGVQKNRLVGKHEADELLQQLAKKP